MLIKTALLSKHPHCGRNQNAPEDLIDLYYYSLIEEKRLEAIRTAFEKFEPDAAVKEAMQNLLLHLHWCRAAPREINCCTPNHIPPRSAVTRNC
jgi:hypothetical protein